MDAHNYNLDLPPEESRDGWLLVRIHVPELNVYKCLQFPADRIIWDVKNQVLASLPKELKESFNYGLFCPPSNGKAGKFLDEERRLGDYPFNGPVGYLELKYKRRVYKLLNLDERQLKALHTRANLRRFIDCVNCGHLDKITKMCAKGLDPNFHCADTGETPLTIATNSKKPSKLLIALVNGGALLDYRTREGSTALHRAVERDNLEAVNTLLELGASPNYRDSKGLTPVYLSVTKRSDPKICENLLHDHAITGTKDTQGWQEVHQACRNGLVHHLEHLLRYGSDMDSRNASGNTPLHVCAVNNQEACAKILLFRGSQTGAHNFANQTAYQVAVIAGNLELAEIIQNYKAEDAVPFRVPPRYNLRRRSGLGLGLGSLLFMQNHSESPPSPCPSEQPFSSASSSLSEGSSSHRSHEDDISLVTDKSLGDTSDIISESSGVGTNSDSIICSIDHVSTKVVCIEPYNSNIAGHLAIQPGDLIDIVSSTDCGFLEGYICGTNQYGFIPANCVQQVNRKDKSVCENINKNEEQLNLSISMTNRQNKVLHFNLKRIILTEPRTVVLHRAKRGFGFILRGAKASSPLMELKPSERCPALQYLDDVDPGGVADMAGLKPGDFLLAINGQDIRCASHEYVVEIIRSSGALVSMTVVSQKDIELADNNHEANGNGYLFNNNHFSSRQCVTLPRKIGGIVGKIVAPLPPRRDPNTTLSVGRARAKSMVAGLEGNDDKEDDDILSTTKSISTESVHHRTQNSGISIPNSQPRIASIKSRPTSGRITTAELEELFQRQQGEYRDNNIYSGMMITSKFQSGIDSGSSTPPISPHKGPIVYASIAEMKRKKTNKIGSIKGKPCTIPNVNSSLKRNFHSTPDLATQLRLDYNTTNWMGTINCKGHRSQDDINTLKRLHLPPPNHPPPPPPIGQVVKVAVSRSSEYESAVQLQRKLKEQKTTQQNEIMSSFKPAANAKLYASPQNIKTMQYRPKSLNETPNNEILASTGQIQKLQVVSTTNTTTTSTANYNTNNNINSNILNKNHPINSPPIPDPDYSLSDSDGEEDKNSIMLARNTKYNAKNLVETQLQLAETSGTSNTSSESANSIPHSFSVDEIKNIRKKLKSSKSYPNNLRQQSTPQNKEFGTSNAPILQEECDNSSSGVSSDQEIAINSNIVRNSTENVKASKVSPSLRGSKKKIYFVTSNEPIIDDEDDRSPSPPILGFQRHNSMTRKQAATIAMSRGVLQRPAVSLVQLPPPLENDTENESNSTSKKLDDIEVTPINEQNADFIVLAPPPQFCDQVDKVEHRSVRIVGAVPKSFNNNRLHTH